jgi:hypothetical protein
MLQKGRSRVRIPMRSFDFFSNLHKFLASLCPRGLQPLTEISSKNHLGGLSVADA